MPALTNFSRAAPSAPAASPSTCPDSMCGGDIGPGPAIHEDAAAAQAVPGSSSITVPDPTQRDPNAALASYDHRMSLETTLGIVFVVLVFLVAITLWVSLDKNLRRRLKRWGKIGRAHV